MRDIEGVVFGTQRRSTSPNSKRHQIGHSELMIDSPGEFNSGLRSRGTEGWNLPRKKGNGSGRKRI